MIRGLAALPIPVLLGVPLLAAPSPSVAAIGLVAGTLAAVGILGLWMPPVTAAACLFLIEYAAGLWLSAAPVDPVTAAIFGIALLFLLHTEALFYKSCIILSTQKTSRVHQVLVEGNIGADPNDLELFQSAAHAQDGFRAGLAPYNQLGDQ